jgi:serine/threonine protein kinase/tetratricopeptide (TPR) repeat protein
MGPSLDDFVGSSRFAILRRLGEGGMGVVYEVEDRERGLRVALKTLARSDADTIFRLKQEFRALADLSHPNLAALYDLVVENERAFFTMELLDGTDFLAWVAPVSQPDRSTGELAYAATQTSGVPSAEKSLEAAGLATTLTLPPEAVVPAPRETACDEGRLRAALAQLAQGLHALHAAGKIHRDIKPSNVRVTPAGRVVLLDFGLVADLTDKTAIPAEDGVVGTVAYMAPEQAAGDRRLGPAADWYAVGVMLYQALAGRLPFQGRPLEVLEAKQVMAALPLAAWVPGVSPALASLVDALLRREPADRPSGAEILARLGVRDQTQRFVTQRHPSHDAALAGRDAELGVLAEGLALAAAGQAATVLVRGPSGIGKSALVARFLERARLSHEAVQVLRGRCYEHEAVPYRALDGLVDHLSQSLCQMAGGDVAALLPADAAFLPALFPMLGRVPAIDDAPRTELLVDQHEVRRRAAWALRELMRALARRAPLVLTIDDLQWGDPDTASLLTDLMGPPDPPPVLLVLCTRRDGSARATALFEAISGERRRIELEPLGDDAARALVRVHLPDAAAEVVAQVVREAAGSPLFLLELLRFAEGQGLGAVAGKGLGAVLAQRIAHLPADARQIAEVVAVAGEPISMRSAGLAAGLGADELRRHISLLRAQRLVRAAGGRADDELEPYHDRVREALLGFMGEERKSRHHRGLATALSGLATPERLARHWHGAGEPERAAEAFARAADEAQKTLDFDRAAGLYRMALALGRQDAETRLGLRVALASALADASRPIEAAQAFREAAEQASATVALELDRRAADALLRGGYVAEGLEATRKVLDRFGLDISKTPRRALVRLLGHRARLRLRGLGWQAKALSAIRQEDLTRVDALEGVAMGLAMVDAFLAGEYCARFVRAALDLGEPRRVGRALALETDLQASLGHVARARELLAALERLTADDPSPKVRAQLFTTRGMVAFFCDNGFRHARELLDEATAIFRASERRAGYEINLVELFICWSRLYLGELHALGQRVPVLVAQAERQGDRFAAVNLTTAFAVVPLAAGQVDDAATQVEAAMVKWGRHGGHFQMQDVFATAARCDVALYRGDVAAARAVLTAAAPAIRRALLELLPMNRLLLLSARGRVALAEGAARAPGSSGRRAAAREVMQFAAALRKTRQPIAYAFVPVLDAGAVLLAGERERGVTMLRATVADLEGFEMGIFVNPLKRRLAALVGGSEGEKLRRDADAWFAAQGVRDPDRFTELMVPGFS